MQLLVSTSGLLRRPAAAGEFEVGGTTSLAVGLQRRKLLARAAGAAGENGGRRDSGHERLKMPSSTIAETPRPATNML